MATAITKPEAQQAKTEKVKLLKAHTHAGRDCKAGDEIEADPTTAAWLRSKGLVEKTDGPAA